MRRFEVVVLKQLRYPFVELRRFTQYLGGLSIHLLATPCAFGYIPYLRGNGRRFRGERVFRVGERDPKATSSCLQPVISILVVKGCRRETQM